LPQRLASAAARLGATLDLHDVAVPGTARHDVGKLTTSLAAVLDRVRPDRSVADRPAMDVVRDPTVLGAMRT